MGGGRGALGRDVAAELALLAGSRAAVGREYRNFAGGRDELCHVGTRSAVCLLGRIDPSANRTVDSPRGTRNGRLARREAIGRWDRAENLRSVSWRDTADNVADDGRLCLFTHGPLGVCVLVRSASTATT